jgi:hypothetical protein
MRKSVYIMIILAACTLKSNIASAQQDSSTRYKNILRYNISSPFLFGFDKCVVFGYERIVGKNTSISVNFGKAAMPALVPVTTDSFSIQRDLKNTGTNFSIDYRFYLAKENRYHPPRGVYIGPYYSFNRFNRDNEFSFKRSGGNTEFAGSVTRFTIHTAGAELGFQFILWKRMAIDMVLIGPGISYYDIHSTFQGTLNEKDRTQLQQAVQQILTQRFPGMSYVLGDHQLDAEGVFRTWKVGFRYLVHIGFLF